MGRIKNIIKKSFTVIKNDGFLGFFKKSLKFAYYKTFPSRKNQNSKDILFVNGCDLPHPRRFRVDHQLEQLKASGISADVVAYQSLDLSLLKYYRGFVFFRCPHTDTVGEFIKQAKKQNKACIFDIDDLVIDQKYTNKIKYIQSLSSDKKKLYDDGVNRMRKTLELCDAATTTTECLQEELRKYTKRVYINRNVASDEMIYVSLEAAKSTVKDSSRIVVGYFSGSITHNDDFEIILPAIERILNDHKNVYIKVVGLLDIPESLQKYSDRIIFTEFMDWREMPKEVANCDLVIAPLVDNIFNQAKSENKWAEGALVGVATLASNVGAFKKVINHKKNGYLVEDGGWYDALDELISNPELRNSIGKTAKEDVLKFHTTVGNAKHYAQIINKELASNIAFVLPTTDISGGVNVILKHAEILRSNGWDVTLVDTINRRALKKSLKTYNYRVDIPGFNIITSCKTDISTYFGTMVATLWSTLEYVKEYPNVGRRMYFVQGFETDFTPHGGGYTRFEANATYNDMTGIKYYTMSAWCKDWLKEKFDKDAERVSNGIEPQNYPFRKRLLRSGQKIKILVEGDSRNKLKNTDEAFRIIEGLDKDKYHISYLSYGKEIEPWYHVDKFYSRVPPHEVGKVYADCDILIKTSTSESFSYPPLEMMATGGLVVALQNDGNKEYMVHKENCYLYDAGDIKAGIRAVEELVNNPKITARLIKNGLATAKRYYWENVERDILKVYNY